MKFNGRPLSNMDASARRSARSPARCVSTPATAAALRRSASGPSTDTAATRSWASDGRFESRRSVHRITAGGARCSNSDGDGVDSRAATSSISAPRRNGLPPVKWWAVLASSGVTTSPSRSCITRAVVAGRSGCRTNTSAAGSRHSRSTGARGAPAWRGSVLTAMSTSVMSSRRETNCNHATDSGSAHCASSMASKARPNRSINVLSAWNTAAASPVPSGPGNPIQTLLATSTPKPRLGASNRLASAYGISISSSLQRARNTLDPASLAM